MKITKALLKQIIQEEVQKVISEQTSFTQAGDAAAAKRAREMEGPGAIEKFLARDVDAADADAVMDFSDEPMDIVADVPSIDLGTQTIKPRKKKSRRGSNAVKQLQKAVGARQDGIPGPKTYGRFMKKANLKPSQLSYKQFMNLLRGPAAPQIIVGMIEMINTDTPSLVGQAVATALGGMESMPMDKAVDTAVEAPSKASVISSLMNALADVPTLKGVRGTLADKLMDLEGEAFKREYMKQLKKADKNVQKILMRRLRKMGL